MRRCHTEVINSLQYRALAMNATEAGQDVAEPAQVQGAAISGGGNEDDQVKVAREALESLRNSARKIEEQIRNSVTSAKTLQVCVNILWVSPHVGFKRLQAVMPGSVFVEEIYGSAKRVCDPRMGVRPNDWPCRTKLTVFTLTVCRYALVCRNGSSKRLTDRSWSKGYMHCEVRKDRRQSTSTNVWAVLQSRKAFKQGSLARFRFLLFRLQLRARCTWAMSGLI